MKGAPVRRSRLLAAIAPFAVAAVLATAACGSSSSTNSRTSLTTGANTAAANAQLCTAVANFKKTIAGLSDIGSSPTAGLAALGNLTSSLQELQTALAGAKGADKTAVQNAVNNFENTLQSITSGGTSTGNAATTAQEAIQPLLSAVKGLAPNCAS